MRKWKPKKSELYWYLSPDMHLARIDVYSIANFKIDGRDRTGNCFKTKAEAEKMRKRILNILKKR